MADGARDDVLGQKAQAAQRAFEARGMSPSKALRRALSKTADVLWDLALVTQSVALETLDQDSVIESVKPTDLLVLLDGPDGAIGLACMDRQVLTAIIEVQTIQQVTQMPVEEDRVLTQTDAAMSAPLIDGTIQRLADALQDNPLGALVHGYRFGAMLEDARSASLLLDASGYRAFRAEIDLALGRRKGRLSFILPDLKPKLADPQHGANSPGPHADVFARVPARLDAVLSRIRIPLSKAQDLKPGDTLKLSKDALDRVEVFAGSGQLIAKGRMGQMNGMRAVRLTWPVLGPVAAGGAAGAGDFDGGGFGTDAPVLPAPANTSDGLPELPATAGASMAEDLPDLPPMDFDTDFSGGGDFDFDASEAGAADPMEENFDIDFGGPMEIDFNE